MAEFALNFMQLFVLSAPWLLVGLLVAAVMKAWIPMDWLQRPTNIATIAVVLRQWWQRGERQSSPARGV